MDVASLASEQWGLVTTGQAASMGVARKTMARWATTGVLERLTHGVYRLAGTAFDPREDLRTAWLTLDPKHAAAERIAAEPIDAVVSHRSAARLHDLGDLDADIHQFTVQHRKQSSRDDVQIRQKSEGIDRNSWTLAAGLPVTTVLATIVDLAADGTDGGHLAGVVRDAIATSAVDLAKLSDALRPYAHRYGVQTGNGEALLRRLLDEAPLPRTTLAAASLIDDPLLAAASEAAGDPSLRDALRHASAIDPAVLDLVRRMGGDVQLQQDLATIASPEVQQLLRRVRAAQRSRP